MLPISVIIITKNEGINISACIKSARLISDDIIVVDSGSTDNTIELVNKEKVTLLQIEWNGYGNARNSAAEIAKNDWIFALDADERITESVVIAVNQSKVNDNKIILGFKRISYFLGKRIRFGNFGRDKVFRIYNRRFVCWNDVQVHEVLIGNNIIEKLLKGHIEHYTIRNMEENEKKIFNYARLNAEKYFSQGKKATFVKRFLSPIIGFIQPYIFRLGFLDGKEGFIVSYSNARCTFLKYNYLHKINKQIR